jgi:hypothetical protein
MRRNGWLPEDRHRRMTGREEESERKGEIELKKVKRSIQSPTKVGREKGTLHLSMRRKGIRPIPKRAQNFGRFSFSPRPRPSGLRLQRVATAPPTGSYIYIIKRLLGNTEMFITSTRCVIQKSIVVNEDASRISNLVLRISPIQRRPSYIPHPTPSVKHTPLRHDFPSPRNAGNNGTEVVISLW